MAESISTYLDNITKQFTFNYVIELGVVDDNKNKRKYEAGITNAGLMWVHENGSPLHDLPARPVLQMTIESDEVKELIKKTTLLCEQKLLNGDWLIDDVEKELKRMCIRIQNLARDIIRDGKKLASLKSRDGIPLYDTGQLMRSITCRLVKV